MEQIYGPQWVKVKLETRTKMRELFLIPKTSHAEVVNNEYGISSVISDGTTNTDLQQLTVEKMRDFLGTVAINENVLDLFKQVVEKIEQIEPVVEKIPETVITSTPQEKPQVAQIPEIPSTLNDIKADSVVVDNILKCSKCAFETKSNFAMKMHLGKKHK